LLPVNDDEPTTSKTDFDIKYLDNLRDKLRKDVVTYTAQNESAARKAQARQNIGALEETAFNALGFSVVNGALCVTYNI